ncbi:MULTISPECIES: HlyD family efflux transporter periplasmic adaptor subunit [Pseudoalteromonas]|uniref:HlyD family efflux transporter periplasmic adaptor subunit n=1 Tax=Pseudoalteromonas TaxID=53246 RepID=UPI0015815EF7|nr:MULTISPECIES: HlyD family efflux transporter periplasmic adaptor subunit [Pseudoalteromonas]MDI4654648.1 HlyD family efflux transporter periplasmic adaptor subunit [Pseudoalteromonas shioyasakiensis]NUJ41038.1 HlyD family efflux transporter periplasmic adaptor subunit [Pseudoalteromonas sp. 0303]
MSGTLQPDRGVVKIHSQQSGIVEELLVSEGQFVSAGDVLIRVKSEQFGERGFETNQSLVQQYQNQVDFITNQLAKQKQQNQLQIENINKKLQSLNLKAKQVINKQALLNQRIDVNKEIKSTLEALSKSGYASKLEFKRQNDSLLLLRQQSLILEHELSMVASDIELTENQLKALSIEHSINIDKLRELLNEKSLMLSRSKQRKLTEILSPIDGKVSGVLAKKGYLVESKKGLMSIIPAKSELIAELFVPTSAIGFIEQGQSITLRYQAFPYEKFGSYKGSIIEVSNVVILPTERQASNVISTPFYRVKARLEGQFVSAYGKAFPLRSDMQLDADIVIEERSLLRWLFDPIFSLRG